MTTREMLRPLTPTQKLVQRARNSHNSKKGNGFQTWFEDWVLDPLKSSGDVLEWQKNEPGVQKVAGLVQRTAKSGADYVLCWRNGQFVAIEVKTTSAPTFPRSKIVASRQRDQLNAVAPKSFLVVRFEHSTGDVIIFRPWGDDWTSLKRTDSAWYLDLRKPSERAKLIIQGAK